MSRALAVAGVMGAGTALVLWAAYLAAVLLPSDRLVWQRQLSTVDRPVVVGPGPQVLPAPIDPNDVGPFQPWQGPVQRGPGVLVPPAEPPVIIERGAIEG
jgi:hypothetical protein